MTNDHDDDLPPPPIAERVPVRSLDREAGRAFSMEPDDAGRTRLAEYLGVEEIEALRFSGRLEPFERDGWRLEGRIEGALRQSCVVTLEPVVTELDIAVGRSFLPGAVSASALAVAPEDLDPESEDEPPEPLGEVIDLGQILVEELALAIDPYPRLPGAELGEMRGTPPGAAPIEPEEVRPFAALAALRDKLGKNGD